MAPEQPELPAAFDAQLAEDTDFREVGLGPDDEYSLADLVNRVLDRGVVITGDVVLSVAGVDLVYLGLNAILTSVSTAREQLGRKVGRDPAAPRAP